VRGKKVKAEHTRSMDREVEVKAELLMGWGSRYEYRRYELLLSHSIFIFEGPKVGWNERAEV
jgi:hypothetical protein